MAKNIGEFLNFFRALRARAEYITSIKRDYDEMPQVEKVTEHSDKYALIKDAVWGLSSNYYPRAIAVVVRELARQQEAIYFEARSSGGERKRVSGKSILNIMALEVDAGGVVNIYVRELDILRNPAERTLRSELVAKRVYAGITTRAELPDFNRHLRAKE
jgi:hypothetical protein